MTEQTDWQPRDGTKSKRCDYCPHWSPLAMSRVMGWCTKHCAKPDLPPVVLLLSRHPTDAITAYNQVCGHFERGDHLKGNSDDR